VSDEEMEISFSYSFVLTAKGVAFYAEKTIRELQSKIAEEIQNDPQH
jgi:hypothetical protein